MLQLDNKTFCFYGFLKSTLISNGDGCWKGENVNSIITASISINVKFNKVSKSPSKKFNMIQVTRSVLHIYDSLRSDLCGFLRESRGPPLCFPETWSDFTTFLLGRMPRHAVFEIIDSNIFPC